jgi:rod shape determining protein RodA
MRTLTARTEAPRSLSDKLARIDWFVPTVALLIAGVGIAALYSMAGGRFEPWAARHAVRSCLGIGLMLTVALVPLRFWLRAAYPLYLAVLGLLAAVPVIGLAQLGARRWLGAGDLSLQPAELMKIALILALARYYMHLADRRVSQVGWVAIPLLLIALPVALVLKQPDLGTAILIALTGLGVMFLAGVAPFYFAAGTVSAAGLGYTVWPYLHEYQRKRLLTFLEPDRDPLGAGYHIAQSKIALGSGGLQGRGFLGGIQSQLNFLPEKHTDFIFTMFAEEAGFVGAVALLVLYAVLLGSLVLIALRSRTVFARLVASGIAVVLGLHVSVNVAMVIGLAPVVGVPLPLVSYGGTSLLTLMFGMGLALSALVHRNDRLRRDEFGRFW